MLQRFANVSRLLRVGGVLAVLLSVAGDCICTTNAAEPWDPGLAYTAERRDLVTYDVDFNIMVTPPYHTKTLKVWLPLPPNNLGQEISDREITNFPMDVKPKISRESIYGNEFAYFEFDHPEGAQLIRHRFKAKVWELRWKLDPARVNAVSTWPASFQPYLRPQDVVSANKDFQATIRQIVPPSDGSGNRLLSVINWVDQNLKYDHARASLRADAQFAFNERRGHCSDYHGLCATMGRSLGVPTRVTYGLNLFPKNSPSHCKLEAFFPPYGWVSFDVSETQRLVRAISNDKNLDVSQKESLTRAARERLHTGFRDNTWLFVSQGTNYELSPPAMKPVTVVRTIYAEADGEALPDPDPANPEKREFSWMTSHRFKADRVVPYPFKDVKTLSSSR